MEQKSCNIYYEFLRNYTPVEVLIESAQKVKNIYPSQDELSPLPLFAIDILKSTSEEEFVFSTNPKNFVNAVLSQFDRIIEDITKVPDIEARVLIEVYKLTFKKEGFMRAPQRPREKPEGAELDDPLEKKSLIENFWLWELYLKVKDVLESGVEPLFRYIKEFDKFKEILRINPAEEAEKVDKEESFKDVFEIRDMILSLEKKEKALREEISKSVQVSFFMVHCKDIIKLFSERYSTLIRNLKDVIAKRAQEQTQKLITSSQEISKRLTDIPPDIEKLTDIKEFMENEIPSNNIKR
jgi:dynein heavy chain, axonemal